MKRKLAILLTLTLCLTASAQIKSIQSILEQLPVLPTDGERINYVGSIDPAGGNADWDWSLYQDKNGEWVVMETDGAGEIENIVQHRFVGCEEPVFKIYVDGADTAAFIFRGSSLGSEFPFLKPLADSYIGPCSKTWKPIRVSRTFIPITFSTHCKVTTDLRLNGHKRSPDQGGGWGHVIWRSFNTPKDGYSSEPEGKNQLRLLKRRGLEYSDCAEVKSVSPILLAPGEESVLAVFDEAAVLSSVRLNLDWSGDLTDAVQNLRIKINFDGHAAPDIYCPVGAFAGDYLAKNDAEYLTMGMSCAGDIYNTFPMPFWESCTIAIENRGDSPAGVCSGKIKYTSNTYDRAVTGYFRNTAFYSRKSTPGADSHIAEVKGYGKMVAAQITAWAEKEGEVSCEGDVHVHIDGRRRPVVQSDGSESYSCFGWGFPTPPESHPFGGYDGIADSPWSMTRLCILDSYPFYGSLSFDIESGGQNDQKLDHAGTIFYYGKDEPRLVKAGTFKSSDFTVHIPADNTGLCIVREFRDQTPGQAASVFIDGVKVREHDWLHVSDGRFTPADDDSFEVPASYTSGKKKVKITLKELPFNGDSSLWNASSYTVYYYQSPLIER